MTVRSSIHRALEPLLFESSSAKEIDLMRFAVGQQRISSRDEHALSFERSDLRVFSQWGEDGIIQHLISRANVSTDVFVEIGVQDYAESNTRFLLMNNNWRGVIVDGDDGHRHFAQAHELDWRYDLQIETSFVTAENVAETLRRTNVPEEFGLLSIDVDGVDYWLWSALEDYRPSIVVCEYNSVLGPTTPITVPYDPDFVRGNAHYSHIYFGASLAALDHLASSRGYSLVGCDRSGTNAFFVRTDQLGTLTAQSVESAFIPSRYCDTRGHDGSLSFVRPHQDRLRLVRDMPVVNVSTSEILTIESAVGFADRD